MGDDLTNRCREALLCGREIWPPPRDGDPVFIDLDRAAAAMARALNATANHLPDMRSYAEAIKEGLRMAAIPGPES